MGTSDFAVASLDALVKAGRTPVAVISQPDKPKGRGYTMTPTPVSARAAELGIPVYKPTTLKNGAIADLLSEIDPELNVVVAYGKILPAYVLDYPGLGSINVHGSLLPMYRGAAPINKVLMDGCEKTGVTTMYMDTGLDTGDMIFKAETEITEDDDFGTLHDRCAALGAELLVKTVDAIEQGTAPRIPQEGETCYASMISKEELKLDFTKPAVQVRDFIRAMSAAPCAYTMLDGKRLKVYNAVLAEKNAAGQPGEVTDPDTFTVACGEGAVRFTEVQPEGGKHMDVQAFLRGKKPAKGTVLG